MSKKDARLDALFFELEGGLEKERDAKKTAKLKKLAQKQREADLLWAGGKRPANPRNISSKQLVEYGDLLVNYGDLVEEIQYNGGEVIPPPDSEDSGDRVKPVQPWQVRVLSRQISIGGRLMMEYNINGQIIRGLIGDTVVFKIQVKAKVSSSMAATDDEDDDTDNEYLAFPAQE